MRSETAAGESGRRDTVAALALCAGVVAAWYFERVAVSRTPIDQALPLIAIVVSLVAWLVRESRWFVAVECAVPLLIGCSIAIDDEHVRLVGFGVIAACAVCSALLASGEIAPWRAAGFVIAGVALLRWIARDRVEIGREALIAAGCVLAALAFRNHTWGIAAALIAALVTPAIPRRTVAIPLLVALCLWLVSLALRKRESTDGASATADAIPLLAIAAVLFVFPWSGVAARALPYFWRASPVSDRVILNYALAPGESVEIDLPKDARALIVSAANALETPHGTVAGRIDGRTTIRIGEIADWGYARRDVFWNSTDALPSVPAGSIHGYGYDAWIDGAGRIVLPRRAPRIRVTAEASLPRDFRLQIESIERESR